MKAASDVLTCCSGRSWENGVCGMKRRSSGLRKTGLAIAEPSRLISSMHAVAVVTMCGALRSRESVVA